MAQTGAFQFLNKKKKAVLSEQEIKVRACPTLVCLGAAWLSADGRLGTRWRKLDVGIFCGLPVDFCVKTVSIKSKMVNWLSSTGCFNMVTAVLSQEGKQVASVLPLHHGVCLFIPCPSVPPPFCLHENHLVGLVRISFPLVHCWCFTMTALFSQH